MNNIILLVIFIILAMIDIVLTTQRSLQDDNNILACKSLNSVIAMGVLFCFYYINIDIIDTHIQNALYKIASLGTVSSTLIKIVILLGSFYIIFKILYFILNIITLPFIEKKNYKKVSLCSMSIIFSFVKSIIVVMIMFIGIMFYEKVVINPIDLSSLKRNVVYSKLEEYIPKYTKELVKEVNKERDFSTQASSSYIITYYNGVTLEEGIESNIEIDRKARELTSDADSDLIKARNIYSWIGNTIEYDYEKAETALKDTDGLKSGAIAAFEDKSGICFDYACLFIAMAREVDLEVRLVTGSAFDGSNYGPHAWNEVYLSESNEWISVDPTFYLAGNYFNNDDFNKDHIKESIVGQW